jgi:hypothetical protein
MPLPGRDGAGSCLPGASLISWGWGQPGGSPTACGPDRCRSCLADREIIPFGRNTRRTCAGMARGLSQVIIFCRSHRSSCRGSAAHAVRTSGGSQPCLAQLDISWVSLDADPAHTFQQAGVQRGASTPGCAPPHHDADRPAQCVPARQRHHPHTDQKHASPRSATSLALTPPGSPAATHRIVRQIRRRPPPRSGWNTHTDTLMAARDALERGAISPHDPWGRAWRTRPDQGPLPAAITDRAGRFRTRRPPLLYLCRA